MKLVVDLATGKEEYIPLTIDELFQRDKDMEAAAIQRKADEEAAAAKAAAKAAAEAKLAALGLSAEEIAAL